MRTLLRSEGIQFNANYAENFRHHPESNIENATLCIPLLTMLSILPILAFEFHEMLSVLQSRTQRPSVKTTSPTRLHINHNLRPQRTPNILLTAIPPIPRPILTQRP